jgi:hypothetical protein
MVVREFYDIRYDGVLLYRTYSDKNVMIKKAGTQEIYNEAIDIENAPYMYEETDILVEIPNLWNNKN